MTGLPRWRAPVPPFRNVYRATAPRQDPMSESVKRQDSLHRFLFEEHPVRGKLVHLDAAWQAALEHTRYPEPVRHLLGQAMVASVLLAATLKFQGSLTLQIQGRGGLRLLVVQCGSDLTLRGMAQHEAELDPEVSFSGLVGQGGHMAITIDPEAREERYQGLVPLEGDSLAACLEGYFERSEQLPTRMWLAENGEVAAGLLLQHVPQEGPEKDEDAFNRTTKLAETVSDEELTRLPVRELLHRLYHEEDVRLFEARTVAFRCRCSREKITDVLRRLGREEVEEIIAEQGRVEVGCEFCGRKYRFDRVDAEDLFTDPAQSQSSPRKH